MKKFAALLGVLALAGCAGSVDPATLGTETGLVAAFSDGKISEKTFVETAKTRITAGDFDLQNPASPLGNFLGDGRAKIQPESILAISAAAVAQAEGISEADARAKIDAQLEAFREAFGAQAQRAVETLDGRRGLDLPGIDEAASGATAQ